MVITLMALPFAAVVVILGVALMRTAQLEPPTPFAG